jgi:hypothetical protein
MKRFLFVFALAGAAACSAGAALTACSSSSPSSSGHDDGGGARDGTAAPAEAGGNHEAGGGDATGPVEGGADATATDGGTDGPASVDAPGPDGGPDGAADGAGDSSPEGPDSGSEGGADGGALSDCGSSPTLHADEAGSLFCGFDGVQDLYCSTGQECCLGGALGGGSFATQQCATLGATCPNEGAPDAGQPAIPVACGQIADCNANGVSHAVACCLQGAAAPADEPGCSYPRATLGTAVVCESSDAGATGPLPCAASEVQMCSSQADCPSGKTCTPGKWKIFQVGFCL